MIEHPENLHILSKVRLFPSIKPSVSEESSVSVRRISESLREGVLEVKNNFHLLFHLTLLLIWTAEEDGL